MKLYRAHTEEFQNQIEGGIFIADDSRKFNHTGEGDKNAGHLYFYSPSVEGASQYKGYDCHVWEFQADANLLDLRVKENRVLLTDIIQMFIDQDEVKRQDMLKHIPAKFQSERMQSPTTADDVINDNVLDGLSYWGQRATDFELGKVMRSQIEALGYDGVVFEEAKQVDVALLNSAIFIKKVA